MMDREYIRRRLAADEHDSTQAVSVRGDHPPSPLRPVPTERLPAAVLVGLVSRPDGPTVILTKRTDHLRDHAGQISLPGGRIETTDEGPLGAALREACEEIGLTSDRVDVLGRLRPYDTITGFHVHPVVGWIEVPIEYILDPYEVAEVFEVPLAFVLDSRNHHRRNYAVGNRRGTYHYMDYRDRHIWGATAGILVELARVLAS